MFLTLLHGTARCTGRLPSSVIRTPTRCNSALNAFPFRGYATSTTPPKGLPRRPPSVKPPSSTRSTGRPLAALSENSHAKKLQFAERIYNAGDRTLYRSTSRTTFFRAFAGSLTTVCALGIFYFWTSGLLNLETYRELNHEHPVAVLAAFSVTSIFLGAAAGYTMSKSWMHVHSIDLVQKSGSMFLQVTVRSKIPFMKTRLLVQPQNMAVDARFVTAYSLPAILVPSNPSESSPSAFTAGVLRETAKAFSRFFYSIFDAARVFFSSEGVITIEIAEGKKGQKEKYFLDASALYLQENEKIVLWDLVETKDPYGYT